MTDITRRLEKLEAEAAKQARPAGGWATYWQSLRKIYGDHGDYSPEELLAFDGIDPAPVWERANDKMYGPNRKAEKVQP